MRTILKRIERNTTTTKITLQEKTDMSITNASPDYKREYHDPNGKGRPIDPYSASLCTERVTEKRDTWENTVFNQARKAWAGNDPTRLRQMAAMFLAIGCDWEYDAVALALGYAHRCGAEYSAKAAMRAVSEHCPDLAA